jgi:hypothetical protein
MRKSCSNIKLGLKFDKKEAYQWTLNEGTLNLTQTKFHTIQGHSRGNMTGLDLGYIILDEMIIESVRAGK